MSLQTGQILNNRYRVVSLLGQGGFGAVYRVWDLNMERPRALKENLDISPEARRQFKRESQILDTISHSSWENIEIQEISIEGNNAKVIFSGDRMAEGMKSEGEKISFNFVKEDGKWKIDF